jgi:hypothetical protein
MQKLVSICLYSASYYPIDPKTDGLDFDLKHVHGKVETHLEDLLADGWTIKQLSAMGGAGGGSDGMGWIVALLEK